MRSSVLSLLVAWCAGVLSASGAQALPLALDLRLQMGAGGEEIAEVGYTDGSRSSLRLGTYAQLGVGALVTPVKSGWFALELEALAGWATWSTGPENTDDRLVLGRLPLELLAYARVSPPALPVSFRLGGGMAAHLVSGVTGRGALDGVVLDVANAIGWVGEVGVAYDLFVFSLRRTAMTYEVGGLPFDASSWAGSLAVVFPLGD